MSEKAKRKIKAQKEQNLIDRRAQMHYIARQVMKALENTFGSLGSSLFVSFVAIRGIRFYSLGNPPAG